jgi:large conductance mechanosensitive channel
MLEEFKAFVARGNVLDLAVAVIIGATFGKIVSSLTDDVIMPIIGKLTGNLDFSSHFVLLGTVPADYKGSLTSYADLKKAGVTMIGYGQFATQIVNFLVIAFVIFLFVRTINRMMTAIEHEKAAAPTAPAADSAEVILLREIRDELKNRD